jgi:Carboxypeptidase regulatory-like domain/TonB-dependent Receptor Plug Domain
MKLLLAGLWAAAAIAMASPAGSIVGLVRDPRGAAVANAAVTAIQLDRSWRRTAVTNAAGTFEFPDLSPGVWTVQVESAGFKRATLPGVVVQVDQSARADVVLELGDVSETVEVTARVPLIETSRPGVSDVIDGRAIRGMPLDGRQYLDLAAFLPGIVPAAPGTQGNGFSVAGIRSQSNVYLLDGVSNIDTQTNQPLNMFRITDAVEEFSVQRGVTLPEFGRGSGGQVNVVTRSGSNDFHGSAFEYLRNSVLTAADFFTNKLGGVKSALKRNQFGATSGGPIWRNRTFFFVSYEGFRQVSPAVSAVLVPTLAQRASVTDPISQRLLVYYPLPDASGPLNYISNVRSVDSDNTGLARIDHALGERDRLSARWTQYWGSSVAPGPTPLTGGNQGPVSQVSAMLNENHSFSSDSWNELRFGYSRFSMTRLPQDTGLNAASILTTASGQALAGVVDASGNPLDSGLPSISVGGGMAALGTNANFPQGRAANTLEVFDNFTKVAPFGASRHIWHWGAHIRREDLSRYLDRSARGSIAFANFADFAAGRIMSATLRTGSTQADWLRYPWDVYWQDEFRAQPNLTISYGVRYERPSAVEELHGHATNFVPGYGPMLAGTNLLLDINPALTGPASLTYRSAPFSLPSSGVYPDRNNFAPMAGFAWSAGGIGVVRGGARVAYDDLFNNVPSGMALAAPANLQTTQTANVTQPGKFPWSLAFNQNVPLISNYNQQGPGTPTVGVISFQGIDPHLRSAYAYVYGVGIEHPFGRALTLEAEYQGSSGHDLGMYVDQNQPAVIVRSTAVRGTLAPNEQIFPYDRFGQAQIAKSIGNSNYNGLVLIARRRTARGLLLQASYTLGKSLDYNSSYFGSGNLTGETGAPIDARNLALEHGPSAFDIRQRFVGLFAIDVPAGPGHRVFKWNNGPARQIFGGWRLTGVVTVQTGNPFTIVESGPDTSGFNQQTAGTSPDGGNRPNLVKPGPLPQDNRAPDAAFDTSWFAPNLAGQDGTSGRNAYYGPGLKNVNLSVAKSFPLTSHGGERTRLQFRADFFNLWNHTNFATPVADLNNANFGHITQTLGSAVATSVATSGGATGGPRVIQLALRLEF